MTEIEKAAERATKWIAAGDKAFELAKQQEKAKLDKMPLDANPENINITIQGAMKLFLDGNILNPKIKQALEQKLDMNHLRRSIVEETMSRAIAKIINDGDIERLGELAKMAGEQPTVPQNATRITQERVIIEIDPQDVIEC